MKTYTLEVHWADKWHQTHEGKRGYLQGWLDHHRESPGPRCAIRLMCGAKVLDDVIANDKVSLGMTAGWPTAEQYEHAGQQALEQARLIREREARRAGGNAEAVDLLDRAKRTDEHT